MTIEILNSQMALQNVKNLLIDSHHQHSGSVVECLNRDQGVAGSSLTGGTALCP